MTRAGIPGLEAPDAALEAELRAGLDRVEEALQKAVRADFDFLTETASHLIAAGGKRFRPMLVLLSGYFGDPTDPRLVPGAVAIELTHLATLYHDDVIDEADFRRGRASANSRWDNTVAILTGDYLFARASEISADLGTDVSKLLARTIATVCDGQIREVGMAGSQAGPQGRRARRGAPGWGRSGRARPPGRVHRHPLRGRDRGAVVSEARRLRPSTRIRG